MGDRTMEIGVMSRTSSRASVVRMISFKLTVSSCQHVSKTVSNVGGMAIGGSGKQEGECKQHFLLSFLIVPYQLKR